MSKLKRLQNDPAAFRKALRIDCDGKPKPLEKVLDPWQQTDFLALDGGWKQVAGQSGDGPTRAWIERPRGHSKTNDLAVMVIWALFASKRTIRGYAAAADFDQSKLLRDAIDKLVRINGWLGAILKVNNFIVSNTRTGSSLEIIASDAPTSYGLTPDFVIADELCHWKKRDLWDSLLSSAAKRSNCMLVVITNAGYGESWQWETREAVRKDPAWYFSRLDGPVASWITKDRLAEQKRLLPDIAYRRLWENAWTSGAGDALSDADINRSIRLKGPITNAKKGWIFFAGLDLGLSRDKAALAVIGRHIGGVETIEHEQSFTPIQEDMFDLGIRERPAPEVEDIYHDGTGKIRLAELRVWSPPKNGKVDIEEIEETIVELDRRFQLQIGADPWQAAYLIERLQKQNIPIEPVDFTGNNLKSMCSATLEAFSEGLIEIYDQKQLVFDLRNLQVVEKSYGVRLVSPRGPNGHGDAATALSIALHLGKMKSLLPFAPPVDIIVA